LSVFDHQFPYTNFLVFYYLPSYLSFCLLLLLITFQALPVDLIGTGCGRKNTLIWEGHSFGWGARRRTAVYVPFSVYSVAWLGEHRAFIVEEFIKNGGSPVATQRAFRIRLALGRREAVPGKKTIYRWVSNFRQTGQTLEALKEAIRQEVAVITPEMILKVMDNYRERLHQCINIQGRHLSDVLFKTR